ncbi:NAD-dependent epimerase/dehydratase family protein [Brevibacillus brevis]|uniref:NAD-dependent epimerase/dehydratase family protein n=1 Tax=Brevibacillus brevis TaxID=1393 RepID=UPI001C8DB1B1|nr:NAD-dependent epimerase/dehydratase family protein [Brevibacillus brevis]MBY0087266.1 NAD-dependent epimerase/dehydratase family protein [Brevibacillus brevis]
MKKVLVLGGTRFFGKRLVQLLVETGADVTVATRGLTQVELPATVKRITLDRDDIHSLMAAGEEQWDVVYDNICYSSQNAMDACKVFRGKVGKYVLTSTLSVYDYAEEPLQEEAFDPYTYAINRKTRDEITYQEGKRQAEAVFFQEKAFPVVAVRFPIVLAEDDYTRRLWFHIEHVQEERPIGITNPATQMCFIHAQEAAQFLEWVATASITGPVNACSDGTVSLAELMETIAQTVGKPVRIEKTTDASDASPFGFAASFYMNNGKAKAAGFPFWSLDEWLPALIQSLNEEYTF